MGEYTAPKSILIVGSGVFGLSTALALSHRPTFSNTHITLIDKHSFPNPKSSSIDSSRIIRADYKDPLYSVLAAEAQTFWRGNDGPSSPFEGQLGSDGRYHESGLVLVGEDDYIQKSMLNVTALFGAEKIQHLKDAAAIKDACRTGGVTGTSGYVNSASGWADAEAGMRYLRAMVEKRGRVTFVVGEVVGFLGEDLVEGVKLQGGNVVKAELTVLAAGAWTPGLINLSGRAVATGQALVYIELTEAEQARYGDMPVILNFTTGLYALPARNRLLKLARHGIGYLNTREGVSVPVVDHKEIPLDAELDFRQAIAELFPGLNDRPFLKTRICWYTDTPTGDFVVCYHPTRKGLFIATGGSGHGYKFLPVLGGEIANILEGVDGARFAEKWAWKEEVVSVLTADGSRGGVEQVELEAALRGSCK